MFLYQTAGKRSFWGRGLRCLCVRLVGRDDELRAALLEPTQAALSHRTISGRGSPYSLKFRKTSLEAEEEPSKGETV